MKLVCHIGTPKTASTFLQNTCAMNPEWLTQNGIIYPDMLSPFANHITLFYAAAEVIHDFARGYGLHTKEDVEKFRKKLSAHFAAQILSAPKGVHTMLMSSENLTGNMRLAGVRGLYKLLKPHFDEIEIIVYLRRQDDAILSMYGEFMRQGFSNETFDQFIAHALEPAAGPPYLFSRRMLLEWIEVFGQDAVNVRLFAPKHFPDGDILKDFLSQVLHTEDIDTTGIERSTNNNISLSAPVLEFLRRVQPAIPFMKDDAVNLNRTRLETRINQLPSKPRPQMSIEQSKRIMKTFAPANRWVRDSFFPDHKGPLFSARNDLNEQGNVGKVTLKDFANFTRQLLK